MRKESGLKHWLAVAGLVNDRPSDSLSPWSKDDEAMRVILVFILAIFAFPFILIAVLAIAQ